MKKLRVVMVTDCLKIDGISSVIINYCTHLNPDYFSVTVMSGCPIQEENRKKCHEYGISLIELPERKTASIKFYKELNTELKRGNYDICHVHGNSATKVMELFIAKKDKIKVRIMHCHNAQCQHTIIHHIFSPWFKQMYNHAFACSESAGNWIFGENKFIVLPNAFIIENYKFNYRKREQYRRQLNLEDAFVIGFVGRINYQKNCWYIIKCFEQYFFENSNAKLLMVGDGPDRKELEQYVNHNHIKSSVIFLGESNDVPGVLSAMDLFLFPSRYEGLGISALEAQISGLPCIISENVTQEVKLSTDSVFLPVEDDNISLWVDKIRELNHLSVNRETVCNEYKNKLSRYDINNACKVLENLYFQYVAAEQ